MPNFREDVVTPHLAFPFRFEASGTRAGVTEQDTPDEIADCVEMLMRTPLGFRIDAPDVGVPDPTFVENGIDTHLIEEAVQRWEPRANAEVIRQVKGSMKDRITVGITRKDDNG